MTPYAQNGSSLAQRLSTQYQQQFGRPADAADPAFAGWVKTAMPQLMAADKAALDKSQHRWRVADKFALGAAAIPFAAAAAPALAGLFTGGAAPSAAAGSVNGLQIAPYAAPTAMHSSLAGGATAAAGKLATLGKVFSSPGAELGVNAGLSLYGTHNANKAADQARLDQLAALKESLAVERQRLELEARNADLDREDARALNTAINELKKRELDAAEEERSYVRGKDEAREARLTPYRAVSQSAMNKLAAMWGLA